jgi:hypothetical protein
VSPNRAKRKRIHEAIQREREVSIYDIEWMARKGQLLKPRPLTIDHGDVSSHLFGPVMRATQMERVNVVYVHEDHREDTQVA